MTVEEILRWFKEHGSEHNREGMGRFGINVERAFGVSLTPVRGLAKELGRNQPLAEELWQTSFHEARLLASLIAEPKLVTRELAESWAMDFNSWDLVDICCNHLLRKTSLAWGLVRDWPSREETFVRRAGYVMMAVLAVHDKAAADETFLTLLPIIEAGATDERNFVKKAVNWALRQIGKRNLSLNAAAVKSATRLGESENRAARWVGKNAHRELVSEKILERMRKAAR
ncbi:DNA alkylation repair protein [bacterium]|nr:DNA alkylation repair protein [bacterium]